MGYLHINNLYKDTTILLFKDCYALEKIHGSSAHISWKPLDNKLSFHANGCKHYAFINIFDQEKLSRLLSNRFNTDVVIYGEVYGGHIQKMSSTYGDTIKFVVFDITIDKQWKDVPEAEEIAQFLELEFVDYAKVSTDIISLNSERDKPSTQSIRNGCGENIREGVVLRPIKEMVLADGSRVICKHKRSEFLETSTMRDVDPDKLIILNDAKAIANEWCTVMRLEHILDKIEDHSINNIGNIIAAMVEDIYREGKGEIIASADVAKAIGKATANLFIQRVRQQEKQASRDKDENDLVSGKKTREQLRKENSLISIKEIDWKNVRAPK